MIAPIEPRVDYQRKDRLHAQEIEQLSIDENASTSASQTLTALRNRLERLAATRPVGAILLAVGAGLTLGIIAKRVGR
jgi:hypothetical protein